MAGENAHVARYRFWEGRFWAERDPHMKIRISMLLAAFATAAGAAGVSVL